MFILFFFRFTLRGGCTIIVDFLKCLRGECLASMRRTTIPGGYRGLLLQCPLPLSFEVNVRKWTFMQPLVLRRMLRSASLLNLPLFLLSAITRMPLMPTCMWLLLAVLVLLPILVMLVVAVVVVEIVFMFEDWPIAPCANQL